MKEISEMTGGKTYLAKNNNSLKQVLEQINKLERLKKLSNLTAANSATITTNSDFRI
jgi:hypothetical protein